MGKCEEVAGLARTSIEALGAKVADVSIYPATKNFPSNPCDVVIIAAYIPGKACLLTVDIDVRQRDVNASDMTFNITGEVNELGLSKIRQRDSIFHLLARPIGSRFNDGKGFRIEYYTGYRANADCIGKNIERGIGFLKKYLEYVQEELAASFSDNIFLWYVPEDSDVLLNNEEKNGKYKKVNYGEFNSKVFAKLPRDIFSANQVV